MVNFRPAAIHSPYCILYSQFFLILTLATVAATNNAIGTTASPAIVNCQPCARATADAVNTLPIRYDAIATCWPTPIFSLSISLKGKELDLVLFA